MLRMLSRMPIFPMEEIETERLLLRRMEMRDARDLFEYSRDEEVARYVLWEAQKNVSESRAYIKFMLRKYRAGDPASWCIVRKDESRVVGTIGYMWFQPENNAAEVGYSLARDCWNQGYMAEALRAVLRYSFEEMAINRIEAQHEVGNPASGAVMRKCGMCHEGTLRSRLYNKGRYVDVELFAILRQDYMGTRALPGENG